MINEPLAPLAVSVADHVATAIAPGADFDVRWAAWVARGRIHDRNLVGEGCVFTVDLPRIVVPSAPIG
jgi:hypothetical protein